MDILYRSKGISQSAIVKKLIAVVIFVAIFVGLMVFAGSKVSGPRETIAIGGMNGKRVTTSMTKARFSSEERTGLELLACVFAVMAAFNAIEMGLGRASWTEIRKDVIKGSFMGKTFSYPVSQIANVSSFGEYLIISGKSGKIGLVTNDPPKARKIINDLLLESSTPVKGSF